MGGNMESRIAVISIIIEDYTAADMVNDVLHDYGEHIVGRMGIPYREKGVNIVCVVIDADNDTINSVSGRLGKINGVSSKTAYSKK